PLARGPAQLLGAGDPPLPDRAGLADLQLLDSALPGPRTGHGPEVDRAFRLAAAPGFRRRRHSRRLSLAVPHEALAAGLADPAGYAPLFRLLAVFDIAGAAILFAVLRRVRLDLRSAAA